MSVKRRIATTLKSIAFACLTLLSIQFAQALEFNPPPLKPMSADLVKKTVAMVNDPKTWERIPSSTTICMYVPGGARGDLFKLSKAYLDQIPTLTQGLKKHGVHLDITSSSPTEYQFKLRSDKLNREKVTQVKLRLYTSEAVVANDFRSKRCDGAMMSNMRARVFNPFVGSLDAIGALPNNKSMDMAIQLLAKPQLKSMMKNLGTEVVGIVPLGAAYIFVNDRKINSVDKAAGKKVAVLSFDPSQQKMVSTLGAQPVAAEVTSFGPMFTSGSVDIIAAPALLFEPFELYKGMTKGDKVTGGIARFPIMQLSAVSLIRENRYPEGLGQLMREIGAQNASIASSFSLASEKAIPDKYWFDVSPSDKASYQKLMREIRISMTKEGFYDPKMMRLLKKIRCELNPTNYECSMTTE